MKRVNKNRTMIALSLLIIFLFLTFPIIMLFVSIIPIHYFYLRNKKYKKIKNRQKLTDWDRNKNAMFKDWSRLIGDNVDDYDSCELLINYNYFDETNPKRIDLENDPNGENGKLLVRLYMIKSFFKLDPFWKTKCSRWFITHQRLNHTYVCPISEPKND